MSHLKKYAAPRSWNIVRKDLKFIKKPNPGPHSLQNSQSIDLAFKQLGLAKTTRDVNYLLNNNTVLIDGRRVKTRGFPLGIMDVLTIKELKTNYRVGLDSKGRLTLKTTDDKNAEYKIVKITGKKTVKQGKTQLNLNDGRTLIIDKDNYKCGDSLIISIPKQEIKEHLPLKEKAKVLLTGGKQSGSTGELTKITSDKVSYTSQGTTIETLKDYAFVLGPTKTVTLP